MLGNPAARKPLQKQNYGLSGPKEYQPKFKIYFTYLYHDYARNLGPKIVALVKPHTIAQGCLGLQDGTT